MRTKIYSLILTIAFSSLVMPTFSQLDENIFRDETRRKAFSEELADSIMDLHLDFNQDWRFRLGETPGFFEPGFDDSDWRQLNVPHDWSVEGVFDKNNPSGSSGAFLPAGTGLYLKHFSLPEAVDGKRIKIRFDGIYMNASVYLNGIFLGERPYGFSTYEYDLTPYLKKGGEENVLAVKVDNSLQPSSRWYTGSGINRNVHLLITEQQHFRSFETFFRTTELKENIAKVAIDCEIISNPYPESEAIKFQSYPGDPQRVIKSAELVALLKNKDGEVVAKSGEMHNLSDYSSIKGHFDLNIQSPVLWSHQNPYLYTLELELWIEGRKQQTQKHQVGIRWVEFNKDQGMLINGEKVIIKGVCLHKDAGSFGTAVPQDVWRYRLGKLKALGCNAIRTHGPVDPAFIEVCDEMGFYMMAEAFDEWTKTWEYGFSEDPQGKMNYTYHKFFTQWAETDLKDMVKRDRNHPSVIIWSVGNEVPEQRYPEGTETLVRLRDWVREEDKTRPVVATCDWAPWANQHGFMDAADIAGYNYPDRYFEKHYQEQHADYPDRILLGAENYLTLENWLMVRDNPYVVGLYLWVGIDYLGEAVNWPRRGWEWGLIDIATFEKPLYYYWQAFWSSDPMVHIAVNLKEKDNFQWRSYNVASHWNFSQGEVDTVLVYSNTEQVELFQNGQSLGKKQVDPNTYQAIYLVDYKKGDLIAKGFKGRKKVADHTLKTAEEAEKLVLLPNRMLKPDIEGLIFLTLEVQDKKGTRCPFAKNEVSVEVGGAGELIGLDSGNQFSHELYKQNTRKAYEGRLLLTIKPSGEGEIEVTCKSGQLVSAHLTLNRP